MILFKNNTFKIKISQKFYLNYNFNNLGCNLLEFYFTLSNWQ